MIVASATFGGHLEEEIKDKSMGKPHYPQLAKKDLWSRDRALGKAQSYHDIGHLPKRRQAGKTGHFRSLRSGLLFACFTSQLWADRLWVRLLPVVFSEGRLHALQRGLPGHVHHLPIREPQPWTEEVVSDRCCLPQHHPASHGGQAELGR